MTMKKLILLSFACVTLLVSCKNKDYKDYKGTWKGSYSGDDNGTWSIEVDEEGNIDGSARSNSAPDYPFTLEGSLSKDGNFEAEADLFFSTVKFNGKLKDDKANGTWKNAQDSISGTWTGKKD